MNALSGLDKSLAFSAGAKSPAAVSRFLTAVWTYWSALVDGLAAARAYQALTSQGETHEAAVAKVLEQHLGGR